MTSAPTTIRLFGCVSDSIVDGPGLRYAVFVQGCTHACSGCHNPESWAFDAGEEVSINEVVARICSNKLVSGVTLSGGDPFCQPQASAQLARLVKQAGYNVWTYTGYVYEDLLRMINEVKAAQAPSTAKPDTPNEDVRDVDTLRFDCVRAMRDLLDNTDVLVDGPFIKEKRSLALNYCGSTNQRLIDMNETRKAGSVVLWHASNPANEMLFSKPESW